MKETNLPDIAKRTSKRNVVVIVAHPDDETLWAGGTILNHAAWQCFIISLCRGKDEDRAPRFHKALKVLDAKGVMEDLEDGPEQQQLNTDLLESTILTLIPSGTIHLIITHSPYGEYTRHIRHEEIGKAIILLWYKGIINMNSLWLFAYEDGNKSYYPAPIPTASNYYPLSKKIANKKHQILQEIYGFEANSWEVKACPRVEAFWQFSNSFDAYKWFKSYKKP